MKVAVRDNGKPDIFHSIQGEGVNVGCPSIFIRLAGCNLRCEWCDTKYSYDGVDMSIEEIIKEIEKYPECAHIVWTGGEPTLQIHDIHHVQELLRQATGQKYSHEIETNGTKTFEACYFDIINISPKKQDIRDGPLLYFKDEKNAFYKFVIESEENARMWLTVIENLQLPKKRCIFMPEGVTDEQLKQKAEMVVNICKKNNIRFTPRVHVWIWGKKQGV